MNGPAQDMPPDPAFSVHHKPALQRFEVDLGGQLGVLDYRLQGARMEILHTGVPRELEGRGIAARLVQAALAHARAEGLKVLPSCSYVASYIRRHPESADLL